MNPCPQCNSSEGVSVGGQLYCPTCRIYFQPAEGVGAGAERSRPAEPAATASTWELRARLARVEKIRQRASNLEALALLLGGVGILVLLLGAFSAVEGDSSDIAWMVFAGALASAFWLFIIAQLVHIRANTEK